MVIEGKRKETTFAVRDNMLDVWKQLTELSYRGFGKKLRKMPKTPRNFETWSKESQEKHIEKMKRILEFQELCDRKFIETETTVVDGLCREIVKLIDMANSINPQYLCECDQQRLWQDEAIGLCNNLKRELNHIADAMPCNKNFSAEVTENIQREIELLRGWRKSCLNIRTNVIKKEIKRRETVAEKMGFVLLKDDSGETAA